MINPAHDFYLVKPDEALKQSRGGIVLPDNATEKQQRGTVLAVGPGRVADNGVTVTPCFEAGNSVLFKRWGGQEVEVDGETLLLVQEPDIIATFGDNQRDKPSRDVVDVSTPGGPKQHVRR